jgi:hypothetical protein
MPKVRTIGATEGEALGAAETSTRMLERYQLADYMGKFIAGELADTFKNEDLNSIMNKIQSNALRLSWG